MELTRKLQREEPKDFGRELVADFDNFVKFESAEGCQSQQ
jgi:hypothetical protein